MVALSGPEARAQAGQDRLLTRYLRREVQPHSRLHRDELRRASGSGRALLAHVAPRRLSALDDPGLAVLRPDASTISSSGDPAMVARLWWAQLARRQGPFNRTLLEPVYKPVQWMLTDGVPIGYSAEDLERLAEIGRATLEHAGLQRADSVVTVGTDPASAAHWQLGLGARRAGIAVVHSAGADEALLARLAPTVVAGPAALLSAAGASPRLRLVIATDGLHSVETMESIARAVAPALQLWTPIGARAGWLSCAGGAFHTWPATELVERHPDTGSLLWTPIQWKGTVLLRADAGVAATVDSGRCAGCGRSTPRVNPQVPTPPTRTSGPRRTSRRR